MPKPLHILVAEDEPTDVLLLRYAMEQAGSPHKLVVVQDGKEAIDYLSGQPPYADRSQYPLPALMLLDLKMPRLTGFDVLSWLGTQRKLKKLPAIVLTSSADDADRERAEQLGAADYLVKPTAVGDLVKLVKKLHLSWLDGK